MFTLPEARGQGLAKTLIFKAIQYGSEEAAKAGKTFTATLVVDDDNEAARALYEKCGFSPIKQKPFNAGRERISMLMKYSPSSAK